MAKLSVVNGQLLLGGSPCAEIGVNAYSLGEKTWGQATPDNVYVTDLPLIKNRGFNVVRIMAAPFDGTGTYGWGSIVGNTPPSTWNDLNSGYRSKIDAIMDAAGNAGLTILPAFFWNPLAIPNMLSETPAAAFTPGSASIAYWEAFASVFVDHFKNHEAYGAHAPFNEWPLERIRGWGTLPWANWDLKNCRGVANRIWSIMRTADPSRCVISGSIAPPVYDDAFKWELQTAIDDTLDGSGVCDTLDWHTYLTNQFVGSNWSGKSIAVSGQDTGAETLTVTNHGWLVGTQVLSSATSGGLTANTPYYVRPIDANTITLHTTINNAFSGSSPVNITGTVTANLTQALYYNKFVGLKELLSEARSQAASKGKAFVMTEFGVSAHQEQSSTNRIQEIVSAIKNAGVQLALVWDWNPRTSLIVNSQEWWSIYPGYSIGGFARGDNYLSVLSNTGMSAGARRSPSPIIPKRCARFSGATNAGISIPTAPRYNSSALTVMGWIRMIGRPAGFSIVADYRNSAATAGWVWLWDAAADAPYMDFRPSGSYNTAARYGRRRTNRWYHYAISFGGGNTSAQLFLDGREFRFQTVPASVTWTVPDGTANLRLGYNGSSGWSRIDMADFALYDRQVDPAEIFNYVFYGVRPSNPVGFWPLQNNANDESGFNNHGTALSAMTFIDSGGARLPR